ncbi:MAG: TonB-dependent receptor [Melioribacter sp.]|nr:TonB-dependent receptor [Melioribacter sp.]
MRIKYILFQLLFLSITIFSQEKIIGTVYEKTENGIKPLPGVNIYWVGTSVGTSSDENGKFTIKKIPNSNKLVFSIVGYKTDTLTVTFNSQITVILETLPVELSSVEISEKLPSSYNDFLAIENKGVITEKELFNAACCNLSESFETNPSIDVSFTDAITGIKQIEMLGLSGIYTQTTLENLPFIRGLTSNIGLTFIPGPWIKAINISKGIGSVVNGFESITGQIDVDLKKPIEDANEKIFFNFYGDNEKRFEGNLNLRTLLNEHIAVVNLLHASSRKNFMDKNGDSFYDNPNFTTYNFMQRWDLYTDNGWESKFGIQFVKDEKFNENINLLNQQNHYKYSTNSDQFYIYAKTGYIFPNSTNKSLGIQISYNIYKNKSLFGLKNYSGKENTAYLNFIYQSYLKIPSHKFRIGLGFLYDEFNEMFLSTSFNRIEKIPGAFFEYTYTFDEKFSFILGTRLDKHSYYGTMFTPRFHFRYLPSEDWVFRVAIGKGYRTSNIFTENTSAFVSSRELNIITNNNFGYGLSQEKAWNFGINLTHYFLFNYSEGTLTIDFYRTQFESVTITDLDRNPQAIYIYSVMNGAYSNSFQVELNFQPLKGFDFRWAYRYLDVKQKIGNEFKEKPLNAKNRILINLSYTTEKSNDSQMSYNLTLQWYDKKRIPSTKLNPINFQVNDYSPAFALVNAQITRTFSNGFDFYLGVENLFDYKQTNPIIDPFNPYGKYFDASLIWGPISGRLIYTGLRYKMF